MDENEQGTATEQIVTAEPKRKPYPKTMTRGPLAGQTFQNDGEYKRAMRAVHENGTTPKRRYRRKAQPLEQGGTYRLQVDLNGVKILAEGRVTQAQLIEMMQLVTPKG